MSSELALASQSAISISSPHVPSLAQVESIRLMSEAIGFSTILKSGRSGPERAADAFFIMMFGYELGIPPVTALRTLHLIKGRPTISGQGMLALLLKAGVQTDIPEKATVTDSATVGLKRPGAIEYFESTFTLADAKKAGLSEGDNWKNYPANMLIWRALSNAARFSCPDIIGGLYTTEEISDSAEAEFTIAGELVSEPEPIAITPDVIEVTPPPSEDKWTKEDVAIFVPFWEAKGVDRNMQLALLDCEKYSEFTGTKEEADIIIESKMQKPATPKSENGKADTDDEPLDVIAKAKAEKEAYCDLHFDAEISEILDEVIEPTFNFEDFKKTLHAKAIENEYGVMAHAIKRENRKVGNNKQARLHTFAVTILGDILVYDSTKILAGLQADNPDMDYLSIAELLGKPGFYTLADHEYGPLWIDFSSKQRDDGSWQLTFAGMQLLTKEATA